MADDLDPLPSPPIRRLLGLVRPYLRWVLGAVVVTLGESTIALATPRIAGAVVDTAILDENLARLDFVVLLLVGLFALRGVLSFGEHYLLRAAGIRFLRDLRARVFSHLVGLAPGFYDQRKIGELLSRIGSDLSRVQTTLTNKVTQGMRAALVFVGTLVMLVSMNVQLTVLALAIVPPMVALAMWFGGRLERLGKRVQDALADTAAVAEEALAGVRTVQTMGREEHERSRYRRGLAALVALDLRTAKMVGVYLGALQFVGFGAFALVLWVGGRLIVGGQLTPGELTAFLLYAISIASAVSTLGSLYTSLRELRGASARTFEILDTPSAVAEPAEPAPLPAGSGRVTFEGVRFSYPSAGDRPPAANGVDLVAEAGQMLALVGPSGAGKSTMVSLISRFFDPQQGRITLDGIDIRRLPLGFLRSQIGWVPQETQLFSGSIAANIRYGSPGATEEEVRSAARAANAAEFIDELDEGYATLVGERGVKLSGGQRQRVAIARALLKDPRILILDEATSSLDSESEALVQAALEVLMRGRTTFVIAHRLATVKGADTILVVDSGRIVQRGTHAELLRAGGLYAELYERQFASEEEMA